MPLIQFVVILIVAGFLLWLANKKIPMDDTIRQILNIVVIIAVVLFVLHAFGLLSGLSTIRIPAR